MIKTFQTIAVFAIASVLAHASPVLRNESGEQKAILVTGATSGIGRNLAEKLAAAGHFVYAGARKEKDMAELSAIENIQAVRLDVTSQEQVDAAVAQIRTEGRGLYALVNNAGVASTAPIHQVEDSDLSFVFGVNVAGVVRVTRAFAPMIIESQGRIATTGSVAGIGTRPGMGVYSMSKHAIEAFSDALAADLASSGVSVSVIEPGAYKTQIRRSAVARIMEKLKAAGVALDEQMKNTSAELVASEQSMQEPDAVSEAFIHALFSDSPNRRYMVVPSEDSARSTISAQMNELVQLNEWHDYRYDRAQLIEMLDQALSR